MIYAYHPSALLEVVGALNARTFNLDLHTQSSLIGLLASKGFEIRGDMDKDVEYVSKNNKLPDQLSFYHPDVTEAFLNYVPEIEEVNLVEGTHPDLGVEISTYLACDLLTEWADLDQDEICARVLTELGELGDDEIDETMLTDLQSCFPLTDDQRNELGAMILRFMDYELDDPDELDDPIE